MGYFNLRCFDAKIGKYIIIVLNALVGILGVTHWGCKYIFKVVAGLYGQLKSVSTTSILGTKELDKALEKLYDSPIAFFSISGVVQVGVSTLVILLVLEVVGKENKLLWVRIVMVLLMVEFAFAFFIAVYTSMMVSYWNSSFEQYLIKGAEEIGRMDSKMQTYIYTIVNFVRYSMFQAIITWILAIPAIIIILISLTDQFVTENTIAIINLGNPQV